MANRYPKDARSVRSIAKELGINHKTVAALERSALAKLRRVPGFAQHLAALSKIHETYSAEEQA